jgi:hypothetical protein
MLVWWLVDMLEPCLEEVERLRRLHLVILSTQLVVHEILNTNIVNCDSQLVNYSGVDVQNKKAVWNKPLNLDTEFDGSNPNFGA